jgi:purine-binding chemotaxis protein CheW
MSDTIRQLVVFSLSGHEYALPIRAVSEIVNYTPPRSVVSAERGVRGVISLRGRIIPVFDLADRLQLPTTGGEPEKIAIVETAQGPAGVIVQGVDEVIAITPDQLEDTTASMTAGVESIVKLGDRLIRLLDPEQLFSRADAEFAAA